MNQSATSLYAFALQQIAAESYFEGIGRSELAVQSRLRLGANREGYTVPTVTMNDGYPGLTRMTDRQITEFLVGNSIVHQWSDDPSPTGAPRPLAAEGNSAHPQLFDEVLANTGLSATLIRKLGASGTPTNEYTLSIRSTEFRTAENGGDRARDGWHADIYGLVGNGFSLAQLSALEKYYRWLRNNVDEQGNPLLPASAKLNVTGYSLGGHLATVFTEIHRSEMNGGETVTFNGAGRGTWDTSVGSLADMLTFFNTVLSNPAAATPTIESYSVVRQAAAITVTGQAFDQTSIYADARYLWAVMATKERFKLGFLSASDESRAGTSADAIITQVYGYETVNNTNATANSGIHGPTLRVGIESQPLLEGWFNDFGNGHALVLIADSLALQRAMKRLDGSFTTQFFIDLLAAASLRVPNNGGNANYEADALENLLDTVRRVVQGADSTPTSFREGAMGFGDVQKREGFYAAIEALTASPAFASLQGKISFEASHPASAATTRSDFAAFLSLMTNGMFSLRASDWATAEAALWPIHSSLYADWSADRSLLTSGAGADALNFTDNFLQDRAALLNWRSASHVRNESFVYSASAASGHTFEYRWTEAGAAAETVMLVARGPYVVPTKVVRFGGVGADALEGKSNASLGDSLYGGDGNDTLDGLTGADYLEGNAGADTLRGGDGADTLVGGAGNDQIEGGAGNDRLAGGVGTDLYRFSATWGADLVRDADGLGLIDVEGFGVLTGAGAAKVAHNVWQLPDQSVNYTLVNVAQNQSDLFITFKTRPDVIRIEGWTPEKSLGITLPGTITPPATNPALTADIVKKLDPTGNSFVFNGVNYVADGELPGAQDILNGWTDAESIAGLGGNDGISGNDGADYLDGGEGDDLLLGGRGADVIDGGDGRDAIFGSGLGIISTPARPGFERGDTTGMEIFSQGFSWTTTRPQLQAGQQNNPLLFRYLEVMGASAGPCVGSRPRRQPFRGEGCASRAPSVTTNPRSFRPVGILLRERSLS